MIGKARLTERDHELFGLLARARWLSTSQIRRQFFPARSANAVNKRMRKLVQARFLQVVRPGMTEECWYRLAGPATRFLDDDGRVIPPKRLPSNLDHFARINDVRFWFARQHTEHGLSVRLFLAEWELRRPDQAGVVIPDGIVALEGVSQIVRVAVEVDCSTENPSVLASKVRRYGALQSPDGRPAFQAVLLLVPGWRRMCAVVKTLYEQAMASNPRFIVADLDRLGTLSIHSKAFLDLTAVEQAGVELLDSFVALLKVSCRPVLSTGEVCGGKSLSQKNVLAGTTVRVCERG